MSKNRSPHSITVKEFEVKYSSIPTAQPPASFQDDKNPYG